MNGKDKREPMYRVIFRHQNNECELYARYLYQSDLSGFVELEQLAFGERSSLVVEPVVEQLRKQFSGVNRTFLPLQSIVRIDEVESEHEPGFSDLLEPEMKSNVTHFPNAMLPPREL